MRHKHIGAFVGSHFRVSGSPEQEVGTRDLSGRFQFINHVVA
jgi:hypothetical protein